MRSSRALSRLASELTRGRNGGAASERAARASSMPSSCSASPSTPSSSSSSSSSSFSTSSSTHLPSQPCFAEIRQYTLHPSKTEDFIAATAKTVHLRKQLPFLAMLQCEVGDLNKITHVYLYDDLASRDELRASLASKSEWTAEYLPVSRACVASQTSMLVQVEAEIAADAEELAAAGATGKRPGGVFDFTVAPRSLGGGGGGGDAARALASERHGGALALRGSVSVGTGGPHVTVGSHVEVWRFADAAAAVAGRSAADAPAAGVSRQLLRPLPYSPWQ